MSKFTLLTAVIAGALSMLAVLYAAGQIKTTARRRWFVIGVGLLVALVAVLLLPRVAQ